MLSDAREVLEESGHEGRAEDGAQAVKALPLLPAVLPARSLESGQTSRAFIAGVGEGGRQPGGSAAYHIQRLGQRMRIQR